MTPFSHERILRAAALSLLLGTASCAYLIPDSPSAPRYNKVNGERRIPEQNRSQFGPQSLNDIAPAAGPQAVTTPAATEPQVERSEMAALPPVDERTRQLAAQEMARTEKEKGFWDALAFWNDDEPEQPMQVMQGDRRPAGNSDYPVLAAVPAAPGAAAVARLNEVRAQLENERAAAAVARDNLAIERAAEPSMLSETNISATAPAPMPVAMAPLPPAPQPALEPIRLTPPQVAVAPVEISQPVLATALPAALPAAPAFAPPAPVAVAPAPQQFAMVAPAAPTPPPSYVAKSVTYFPANEAANLEPITLRPPVAAPVSPAPAFSAAPAASMPNAMAPAMAGGFNPMAEPAPINLTRPGNPYATGRYLPESRYAGRRAY